MTQPSTYWAITALVIGEAVPGATFTVFIGDGEDAESDGFYFDFQRPLGDGVKEQDVRNETDSYCVVNESDGVHYGGLEEVSLLHGVLCLRFDDDAVEALELPANDVPLAVSPDLDTRKLEVGLRRVLSYGNPARQPRINF